MAGHPAPLGDERTGLDSGNRTTPPVNQMTRSRYLELVRMDFSLTVEEIKQGYHFCPDWDYDVFPVRTREGCTCPKIDLPPPDEGIQE
jgi:hypothetical protein